MLNRNISIVLIILAFVVGSVLTGTIVFADEKPTKLEKMCGKESNEPWKIRPECELLNLIKDVQGTKLTKVSLHDDLDGNSKGWNPDGSKSIFEIKEDSVTTGSIVIFSIESSGTINCVTPTIKPIDHKFVLVCEATNASNPLEGDVLNYIVLNT